MGARRLVAGVCWCLALAAVRECVASTAHYSEPVLGSTAVVQDVVGNPSYSPVVPPLPDSGSVQVKLGLAVSGVNVVDFASGLLDVDAHVTLSWEDSRLKWQPNEYFNQSCVQVDPSDVWKPTLRIVNSDMGGLGSVRDLFRVAVCFDGALQWSFPERLRASCAFEDTAMFPFDFAKCLVEFGIWNGGDSQATLTRDGSGWEARKYPYFNASLFNQQWSQWLGPNYDDADHAPVWSQEYNIYRIESSAKSYRRIHLADTWDVVQYKIMVARNSKLMTVTTLAPAVVLVWISLVALWMCPDGVGRVQLCCICLSLQAVIVLAAPTDKLDSSQEYNIFHWVTTTCFFLTFTVLAESLVVCALYRFPQYERDPQLSEKHLVLDPDTNKMVPRSLKKEKPKSLFGKVREAIKTTLFIPWSEWEEMDKSETMPALIRNLHTIALTRQKRKDDQRKEAKRRGIEIDSDEFSSDHETFEDLMERKQLQANILSTNLERDIQKRELEVTLHSYRLVAAVIDQVAVVAIVVSAFIIQWVVLARVEDHIRATAARNVVLI